MKFLVRSGCEHQPIDSAYMSDYTYVDERTTNHPAKVPAYAGETAWWFGEGENHRVSPQGLIQRDLVRRDWFVDIDSLGELLAIAASRGGVEIEISPIGNPPTLEFRR